MLSAKKATGIARKFLEENYPDLPCTTFAMPRRYLPNEKARVFEACYADANLCQEFTLLIFRVRDDGTIDFREDRRDIVRQLLKQKGTFLPDVTVPPEDVFDHLHRAVTEPGAEYPEWIISIEMVGDDTADAIATVTHPTEGEHLRIPVAAFRRHFDRKAFFHLDRGDPNKMVTLIIPHAMPLADIRKNLTHSLMGYRRVFQKLAS
jgi:hypothetical protein